MARPESWAIILATALMFFAVAVGFLVFDLRPQAVVAMASALLMAFVAGYLYRAAVIARGEPPRLGSLWLQGDPWPEDDDRPADVP